MREYQILKASLSSTIESAEPLLEISSVLKDHEETRRSLTKVGTKYIYIIIAFRNYASILFLILRFRTTLCYLNTLLSLLHL